MKNINTKSIVSILAVTILGVACGTDKKSDTPAAAATDSNTCSQTGAISIFTAGKGIISYRIDLQEDSTCYSWVVQSPKSPLTLTFTIPQEGVNGYVLEAYIVRSNTVYKNDEMLAQTKVYENMTPDPERNGTTLTPTGALSGKVFDQLGGNQHTTQGANFELPYTEKYISIGMAVQLTKIPTGNWMAPIDVTVTLAHE